MKIYILFLIFSINLFPQVSSNKEKDLKFFLGLVGGNPINVNPTIGIYWKDYGIRLSGGAWVNNRYGVQLDLTYIFPSKNSIYHQVSLIAAYAHNRKITRNHFFANIYRNGPPEFEYIHSSYFGLAYSLLWNGFFIQTGPAFGTGNFEKPKLMIQLGYIYVFD